LELGNSYGYVRDTAKVLCRLRANVWAHPAVFAQQKNNNFGIENCSTDLCPDCPHEEDHKVLEVLEAM
jgi:hypothetical protein